MNRHATPKRLSARRLLPVIVLVAILLGACRKSYTPRPDGYFRIDPYPEEYQVMTLLQPGLSFEIPRQAVATQNPDSAGLNPGVEWVDIRFPRYRATLYCSYHRLCGNLESLLDESRDLVYRQSIHPDFVQAHTYENPEASIYATLYDLSPESATPLQFVATDSLHYLLRGSLYFDETGKSDSIAPVVEYLQDHIAHLIESIEIPQN